MLKETLSEALSCSKGGVKDADDFDGRSANGASSDDADSRQSLALQGYKTVTTDSDDEIIEGAMVNRGGMATVVIRRCLLGE